MTLSRTHAFRAVAACGAMTITLVSGSSGAFAAEKKVQPPTKVETQSSDEAKKAEEVKAREAKANAEAQKKQDESNQRDDVATTTSPRGNRDYPLIENPGGEIKAFAVCTWKPGNGQYYTVFGYAAAGNMTVSIGQFNNFAPGAANQGQPTQFNAGTTNNAVVVAHTGNISWNLGNSVAAGPAQESCKEDPMPITGGPLSLVVWVATAGVVGGVLLVIRRRRTASYF